MVSSLECPLRAESAEDLRRGRAGVDERHGEPSSSPSISPSAPRPGKGVVKLKGATRVVARQDHGQAHLGLPLGACGGELEREARELLGFLLDGAAALELEAKAVVVQAPLPFPSEGEDEEDGPPPGEKPARARG